MRLLLIEQRDTDTIAVIRPVRQQRVGDDGRRESLADYYDDVWARSVDGDPRLHADGCRCAACCRRTDCTHKRHGKPQWRTWTVIEGDELPPRESRERWRIRDGGITVIGG